MKSSEQIIFDNFKKLSYQKVINDLIYLQYSFVCKKVSINLLKYLIFFLLDQI